MYSPHTTNAIATDCWSIYQLNTYVQVCMQPQKLRSSMCLRIASVAGGIIFVHVRGLSREASTLSARQFSSPFSTRLNSFFKLVSLRAKQSYNLVARGSILVAQTIQ